MLNRRRGNQERSAVLVAALVQYLGVDAAGLSLPRRGRPRKKEAGLEDQPANGPQPVPQADRHDSIDGKNAAHLVSAQVMPIPLKTLFVSPDRSFVRFAYEERDSPTGKAIVGIVKGHGGAWDGNTGWRVPSLYVLEAVKKEALKAKPAWEICEAPHGETRTVPP